MFKNAKPIQRDKLHDQVYDRLCMLLREGEFTPGEAVRVAHVAEAFGVSASRTGMVLVPIFFASERIDSTLPGKYSPMISDHFTLW